MKTILFVQGLGMTKHEYKNSFDEIAQRLHDAGFKTIQFDFPIFHNGKTREMPLQERAQYVNEVAKKYKPDGLLAQSYGVATALYTNIPTVRSQLFVGSALSLTQSIIRVYEEKGVNINFSGDTSLPRTSGENTTVGKEFWQAARAFDDLTLAKRITIPTCLLHGDHDTKIPVPVVKRFFNAIPVKRKKLKIFKGGDHGIVDVPRPLREEFLADVVNWFKETL